MTKETKNKKQFLNELKELQQRAAKLEILETERTRAEEKLRKSEERLLGSTKQKLLGSLPFSSASSRTWERKVRIDQKYKIKKPSARDGWFCLFN